MLIKGQLGAVAGQVEMAIDEVLAIAKSTVSQIEDTAQSKAARPFRDMEIERSAFSQVPAAQEFAGQHEAAKQVFLETIDGVVTDLAEFKQRLLDSAKAMEAQDQTAEEMFTALGRSYEGHQFASDASYDQGRTEHAQDLSVPDASRSDGQDAGAQAEPTSAEGEPGGGVQEGY